MRDKILLRLALADELVSAGLSVLEAADAKKALLLLENRAAIEVMIADISLPGALDGFELFRRARELRPGLKTIILPSNILHAGAVYVIDGGVVNAFDPKPYAAAELIDLVRQLLSGRLREL